MYGLTSFFGTLRFAGGANTIWPSVLSSLTPGPMTEPKAAPLEPLLSGRSKGVPGGGPGELLLANRSKGVPGGGPGEPLLGSRSKGVPGGGPVLTRSNGVPGSEPAELTPRSKPVPLLMRSNGVPGGGAGEVRARDSKGESPDGGGGVRGVPARGVRGDLSITA